MAHAGDGLCVGHALITAVPPLESARLHSALVEPARAGLLFELGGLAVRPQWQGRGVARALRDARLDHLDLAYPGSTVVTVVWPGSPSHSWYARAWELLGEIVSTKQQRVLLHRRPR